MYLRDGDGDALASALLSESKETMPCMVYQKEKGVSKTKERKMPHIVC
jgi:hypothetical protein